MIPATLLLAFLQSSTAAVPLRDGCSADDPQVASINPGDPVKVLRAIAGGDGSCYRVDLLRDGHAISGYVRGETLPAIADFIRQRDHSAAPQLEAMARVPAAPPPSATAETKQPVIPENAEVFADFSARDLNGKLVSLAALHNRAILITFWSRASRGNLFSLMQLVNQNRRRGLFAIGIGMDGRKQMTEAFDDITLSWPQVPDPGGLARRYNVDPRKGTSFVLDSEHRIVASGLDEAELEKKIRELLN